MRPSASFLRPLAALALAVLGCLWLAASALAAPTWLQPIELTGPASQPQVAANAQGDSVAIWEHTEGNSPTIEVSGRPAGGEWGAPVELGPADPRPQPPEFSESKPQVAIGADGAAVAIWQSYNGSSYVIESASRPAAGQWSTAVELSAAAEESEARVAMDPAGTAVAIWTGANSTPESASRPAGGQWSIPTVLAGQEAFGPRIGVDAAGESVAVWGIRNGPVQSASRPAGGGWSAPASFSAANQVAYSPEIAVDGAGDAVAVWSQYEGSSTTVQTASRPAEGDWSTQTLLSAEGQASFRPRIATDAGGGNAVVVWERNVSFLGGITTVESASRSANGNWSAPIELAAGQFTGLAQVAMSAGGDAVAVWDRILEYDNAIETATRPAGGQWGTPSGFAAAGDQSYLPQVAMDAGGDAVAVWEHGGGLQAVGYDATGPSLDSLTIPTGTDADTPLSFSVSAFDIWSAVEPPTWSFGDGSSANGESVSHSYARPGEYTVTVTVTDAVGNTSSATGTVAVTAGAIAPPAGTGKLTSAPRVNLLYTPNHPHEPDPAGGPRYTFHFSNQNPEASFDCRLDDSRFKPCSSPRVYRRLARGRHVLRVKSLGPDGEISATRVVHFFADRRR